MEMDLGRPSGTCVRKARSPALKRWANLGRPCGAGFRAVLRHRIPQDILAEWVSGVNIMLLPMASTMPTTDNTLDEILSLAAAHFKVPREKLTPDGDFFKTLGIDSLQALDLLTRLEHHFRIELPDYELQGVSDFRTLAQRIQARL
jgi:acyl carrier protein